MQRGGSVADVWVVCERPVESDTMLPRQPRPIARSQPGVLPSRAADNLFWLGRYVERAEGIDAPAARLSHPAGRDRRPRGAADRRISPEHLEALGIDPAEGVPAGLRDTLAAAMASASNVRDRFSVDGWMALNDLAATRGEIAADVERRATTPPARWACCCARSPASPAWCTTTCTASPAGGF